MRRRIGESFYNVVGILNYISMADSFVMNKRGAGHGEAKLYVGNESDELYDFFNGFSSNLDCFFLKVDFENFFQDAKSEFENPSQAYSDFEKLHGTPAEVISILKNYPEKIEFSIERRKVSPPRIYISALPGSKVVFDIFRKAALPNVSFTSIMKLEDDNGKHFYYFRLFFGTEEQT